MEAFVTPASSDQECFPKSKAEQQRVVFQLEQILASPHFSHSKRSQTLFRYIVAKTLEGEVSVLKERTLGVEVFSRAPDYDTNSDPIVRMTAGEIRKRIAQYYHDSGHRDELQIDIPSGGYVARFHLPYPVPGIQETAPETSIAERPIEIPMEQVLEEKTPLAVVGLRSTRTRVLAYSCAGFAVVLAALYLLWLHQRPSFVQMAWGGTLVRSSTTLISLGEPKLYMDPKWSNTQLSVSGSDHIAGDVLTYSEVQALVRIVRLFDTEGVPSKVQVGGMTTFADLRQSPAVLLGGLNQPWTLRAQQSLRFRLATDGKGLLWIFDAKEPNVKKFIVDLTLPYSALTADYAIIARFVDPNTQQPTLIIAGAGEDGTKAAGEFITDEKQLQRSLGPMLKESKGKSFEIILGTQVINGISGPPKVLVKEIW